MCGDGKVANGGIHGRQATEVCIGEAPGLVYKEFSEKRTSALCPEEVVVDSEGLRERPLLGHVIA